MQGSIATLTHVSRRRPALPLCLSGSAWTLSHKGETSDKLRQTGDPGFFPDRTQRDPWPILRSAQAGTLADPWFGEEAETPLDPSQSTG